jgi:monothiol glutaredoxin
VDPQLKRRLEDLIAQDQVVLFMKGTRDAPRCGFSKAVVDILEDLHARYSTVDVLADPAIREGVKELSQWPTIPQLFIKGEMVGGADIAKEMHASGELASKLGLAAPTPAAPASAGSCAVTLTPSAAAALKDARKGAPADHPHLRISVSTRFKHTLGFGPELPGDVACDSEGVSIRVEAASARRANGLKIDVVEGGFRLENPNEPKVVKAITARELKARMDAAQKAGTALALFDVRSPGEVALAAIPGARLLDDAGRAHLEGLAKDTSLFFICHHGGRSQAAAEHYLSKGFKDASNVAGGIDAWSQDVDPSVPRY